MNNLFANLLKKKELRLRFVIISLIIIYMPIAMNIYLIYSRTLAVVKEEKVTTIKKILSKTEEALESNMADILDLVKSFATNLGTGASIGRYHAVDEKYRDKIDLHIQEKVSEITDTNHYIINTYCITKDGKITASNNYLNLDRDKFFNSDVYKTISTCDEELLWMNVDINSITNDENLPKNGLFLIHKVYYTTPEHLRDTEEIIYDNSVVGYVMSYIDHDRIIDIFREVSLNPDNEIIVFDQDLNPITKDFQVVIPMDFITSRYIEKDILIEEITMSNKKYNVGLGIIDPLGWYVVSIVPVDSLIESTKKGVKETLWILGFISIMVSAVIIIVVFVLSKIITEKEMIDYRLGVSETVNEKLRMYKHDFMNHLQIVQALLEMDQIDRANDYLKKVAKEGHSINNNYVIGIPELEATINSLIQDAREFGIEVKVNTIEIKEELPINTYDLIKILTNLIKNAMYELVKSEKDYKVLEIRISFELDNYIFEVCNNTPIIPKDIREQIFNKGFSTKGVKGDGLGLHIVKKLAQKYNGEVSLVVDDDGNHFIVSIPNTYKLQAQKV